MLQKQLAAQSFSINTEKEFKHLQRYVTARKLRAKAIALEQKMATSETNGLQHEKAINNEECVCRSWKKYCHKIVLERCRFLASQE